MEMLDEGTLRALIQKFPALDYSWPEDLRRVWLSMFGDLLTMATQIDRENQARSDAARPDAGGASL